MSHWTLIFLSIVELVLLLAVLAFFRRLKRSETLLNQLAEKQDGILAKLHVNAELEQELVDSFAARQAELEALDRQLERRVREINALVRKAEEFAKPQKTLRALVLEGRAKGRTVRELARDLDLSTEEIELILAQNNRT